MHWSRSHSSRHASPAGPPRWRSKVTWKVGCPGAAPGRAREGAEATCQRVRAALGTGVGSELRRPLGITIIGGLLVSQLLTLYTTPVIYLWFDAVGGWVRGPVSRDGEERAEGPAAVLERVP